jgi:hypothetical protein
MSAVYFTFAFIVHKTVSFDAEIDLRIRVIEDHVKLQIDMIKTDAKYAAEMHKVELERVKVEAQSSIVTAENRVAEKFRTNGYTEEYNRYQELTKIKKEECEKQNE